MASAKFEIGDKEKHKIEVDYSAVTGKVRLMLNGKELSDSHHMWLGPKKFQFNVGDTEKHKAEIRIGTYGHKFELFVDGKLEGSG